MRVGWEQYFLEMVDVVRKRSTCTRLSVGSVIVKDNVVVSTGYNGSPKDEEHCIDVGCLIKNGSCVRTIHAEMNAIMNSLKNRVNIEGSTIYVSHFPCYNCAKHIAQVGIKKVVYKEDYRNSEDTYNLFSNKGIEIKQIK